MSASLKDLSKRERQVMAALYEGAPASVNEILERMADPPSYSAVRAALRVLHEKGLVDHEPDGRRYLYKPAVDPKNAGPRPWMSWFAPSSMGRLSVPPLPCSPCPIPS